MRKCNLFLCIASLIITAFVFSPIVFSADETITISTYYPAPYGIYKELRAQRVAIGENYINNAQYCWAPNTCTNQINTEADLVVEGRVGIGKTNPMVPLHIHSDTWQGNAVISGVSDSGLTYSSLLLSDDNSNYLADSWALAHKKMAGTIEEDDFHIVRWMHPTARVDMVIDASTGNVGIATGSPQAKLEVLGGVKIGDDTTCNAGKAGTLRYNSGSIQYCDGTAWRNFGGGFPAHTGWVEWQEGVKIGGKTDNWGEQGFSCGATNGTGRCSEFQEAGGKPRGVAISCSDGKPLLIFLLSSRSYPSDNQWMQWFYRGYCVSAPS